MGATEHMMGSEVDAIKQLLLGEYQPAHANAIIEVRANGQYIIRVRITDTDFEGLDFAAREDMVWPILQKLPDEVFQNITMVLLITPKEKDKSIASWDFDNPVPSLIEPT